MKKSFSLSFLLCFLFNFIYCQSTQDFEGDFPPDGWTNNGCFQSTTTSCVGIGSCYFNNSGDNVITPLLANPVSLSFQYRRGGTFIDGGIDVDYSNSSSGPWTPLTSFNDVTESCQIGTVNALMTNIYIRFTDTRSTGTARRYIDEVTVEDSSLPVSFADFNLKSKNNSIQLSWQTESEINNDFFTVQHSLDGRAFHDIETIDGAGNSLETISYTFVHKNPFSGLNYYRLKQTDFDGRQSFSPVESIHFGNRTAWSIYPNPARDNLTINFPEPIDQNLVVSVYDLRGKLYRQSYFNGESNQFELPLLDLTQGQYLLKILTNNLVSSHLFFKK